MNWIERVATILREKVVFTVGGQKPVGGDVPIIVGGDNLIAGAQSPHVIKPSTSSYSFDVLYRQMVDGKQYIFDADVTITDGSTDAIAIASYNGSNGVHSIDVKITNGHITGIVTPTNGEKIFIVYAGTANKTAGIGVTLTNYSLREGNVRSSFGLKSVIDVGGQYADEHGHINMDAYALKDDTATKSDITALNNKIAALETQLKGGTTNV